MKLFECQSCGQPLYFENTRCESCGLRLGYLPAKETVTALEEGDGGLQAMADSTRPLSLLRQCASTASATGSSPPTARTNSARPAATTG